MQTVDEDWLRGNQLNSEEYLAKKIVFDLIDEHIEKMGSMPTTLWVDCTHELQSLIMFFGFTQGLVVKLVNHKTGVL